MGSIAIYQANIQAIEDEAIQTDGTPEVLYPYLSKAYYMQKDMIAMMLNEVPTSNTDECLPLIEAADARATAAVASYNELNQLTEGIKAQMLAQDEEIVQLKKALATAAEEKQQAIETVEGHCSVITATLQEYEETYNKLRGMLN